MQMDRSDGCLSRKRRQEDFRPPTQTTAFATTEQGAYHSTVLSNRHFVPQSKVSRRASKDSPVSVRHGVSHLDMASISISQHPIILSSTASNSTGVWTRNSTIVGTWYLVSPPPPARPHSPFPPSRLGVCLFAPAPPLVAGAALRYRMLLQRISTSPKKPANCPSMSFFGSRSRSIIHITVTAVWRLFLRYSICPHLSLTEKHVGLPNPHREGLRD
jgi:hypothetical protein